MNLRKHELLVNIHKLNTKLQWQIPRLINADLRSMNGHLTKEKTIPMYIEAVPNSFYDFLFSNMKFIPNIELEKFEKQLKQEVSINQFHLREDARKWQK